MLTKKQSTILFCLFLFSLAAFHTQPVDAFASESTNQDIPAGNWYKVWDTMIAGDVITGYFETHADTQGLDFFICDSANLALWEGGFSATVFELNEDMHTLGFEFTVTSSDVWTCVFSNYDGLSTVTADIGVDLNDDTIPYFSPSLYDYTGYGEVLPDEDFIHLTLNLDAGTEISGAFATFFDTDGLDFFICDNVNYNLWFAYDPYTAHSELVDMHTATITPYTVPTTDTWHVVFYAHNEIDTVTFSYWIDLDTSGVGTTGTSTTATTSTGGGGVVDEGLMSALTFLGLGMALLIILILCCVCRSKKKDSGTPPPQPTVDHYRAPPATPAKTETVREREIVRDRVLVICPYCGSKNEQGVLTCHNCDADL